MEEAGETTEILGMVGVSFDSLFVRLFRQIIIMTNIPEKNGIITETISLSGVDRQ